VPDHSKPTESLLINSKSIGKALKVIQVPFGFYPDPVGGTEVYVEALSQNLQAQGVEVVVAAPGNQNHRYEHHQLPVYRFATSDVTDLRDLYGAGDEVAVQEFSKILDQEQPDLVHLHALTRGVSLRLVQAAKQRNVPVIFTYHTPTVSCQRGTLLKEGTQVCDGKLELRTCARCTLQGLGLNTIQANAIGSLSPWVGSLISTFGCQGGAWTALRMTELLSHRHKTFHQFVGTVDHVIAVCNWVRDVLIRNQVPSEKITVIRQGLCHTSVPSVDQPLQERAASSLKLVFLGRLDPTKGIHILIQTICSDPNLAVHLDIYGISQGEANDHYQETLKALVGTDSRIQFKLPISSEEIIPVLASYDLMAVPSQWLETGPMVILEAFAARVPVIGSNLGGIAELIHHGINGILVDPMSVEAWKESLKNLSQNREQLAYLRSNIVPPGCMDDVATQMLFTYHKILKTYTFEETRA
jgi:glycosyltransferase involved in cell wall biosynthesis